MRLLPLKWAACPLGKRYLYYAYAGTEERWRLLNLLCYSDGHVSPVALCLMKTETAAGYSMLLSSVKGKGAIADRKDVYLVTDNNPGLDDACSTHIPAVQRLFCWAHLTGEWLQGSMYTPSLRTVW